MARLDGSSQDGAVGTGCRGWRRRSEKGSISSLTFGKKILVSSKGGAVTAGDVQEDDLDGRSGVYHLVGVHGMDVGAQRLIVPGVPIVPGLAVAVRGLAGAVNDAGLREVLLQYVVGGGVGYADLKLAPEEALVLDAGQALQVGGL